MNIALITDNYFPKTGGVANVMVNLSKHLRKQGEQIYVLNSTYDNPEELCFKVLSSSKSIKSMFSQNKQFFFFIITLFLKIIFSFKDIKLKVKIKLCFFYCFYPKLFVSRIISIKNAIPFFKKKKIDIILSGSAYRPLIYSYILAKWFKIPLVTIAHGDDFLKRFPYRINSIILQNIDKIITTNKIMKNLLLKIHKTNPNKTEIIHLGVDIKNSEIVESISELREKLNISPHEFVILTVSRFYPRKGFNTIFKALRLIIDEYPDILIKHLIIGGGEEQTNIEKSIKDLELGKHTKVLINIDNTIKNQYFKLSNLFVLVPEIKKDSIEGFGIVFIEANYFKLPVIGSNSGGVKIAIEDGKSGFLIEPNNEISLKEKILLLYNNKQLCKDLGEYGHKRVIELFNWSKNAVIYQDILKKVVH